MPCCLSVASGPITRTSATIHCSMQRVHAKCPSFTAPCNVHRALQSTSRYSGAETVAMTVVFDLFPTCAEIVAANLVFVTITAATMCSHPSHADCQPDVPSTMYMLLTSSALPTVNGLPTSGVENVAMDLGPLPPARRLTPVSAALLTPSQAFWAS